MSKLDYVTIAIVVVCITALIYLVVNIFKLRNNDQPGIDRARLEVPAAGTEDEGTYAPDESGAYPDASPAPGAIDDYDPDDDEVDFIDPGAQPDEAPGTTAEASEPAVEPPPAETAPSPRRPASEGEYLVLAGSYRIRDNADREVRKLQRLGYANAEATIFNRGAYATVLVERFESMDDARAMVKELKSKHGIDSYVQRRRADQ